MAVPDDGLASSTTDLAGEQIAVRIRWFGLAVGYALANAGLWPEAHAAALNAILTLGALYTLIDTYYSLRGRVFLAAYPLLVGAMEAVFIGLLCYFERGLDSPFRFYYLLSLVIAAIRYPGWHPYVMCLFHSVSALLLYLHYRHAPNANESLFFLLVLMVWVAWAANSLAAILKKAGEHLRLLNRQLCEHQLHLEGKIAEHTRELQEAQACMLHQEKMAAFGLLAAGIAHEVGNPLTSISSLVQILQRRCQDAYAQEKLALVRGELRRIQGILRELIDFSRPGGQEPMWITPAEVIQQAVSIAKYYKPLRGRVLEVALDPLLPPVRVSRDAVTQALLNLILNAIDATPEGGRIVVRAMSCDEQICLEVVDNGPGIPPAHRARLFAPFFTTKPHGTGLGLFVTKKLVSDQGGTVSFESGPGHTVFRIRLPIAGAVHAHAV